MNKDFDFFWVLLSALLVVYLAVTLKKENHFREQFSCTEQSVPVELGEEVLCNQWSREPLTK
jgi:hypothetical protein